jgi:hypothetical protein
MLLINPQQYELDGEPLFIIKTSQMIKNLNKGLTNWIDLYKQIEVDIRRLQLSVNSKRIYNLRELKNKCGPFSMDFGRCCTQAVFANIFELAITFFNNKIIIQGSKDKEETSLHYINIEKKNDNLYYFKITTHLCAIEQSLEPFLYIIATSEFRLNSDRIDYGLITFNYISPTQKEKEYNDIEDYHKDWIIL